MVWINSCLDPEKRGRPNCCGNGLVCLWRSFHRECDDLWTSQGQRAFQTWSKTLAKSGSRQPGSQRQQARARRALKARIQSQRGRTCLGCGEKLGGCEPSL